jgi:threonine/homoserine/homoserine lactone efflux protein
MNTVIGDILPLALGVAISPIPIIAAILMLLSPRAKVTSTGFLLGWVAGIVVATTVFTLLSSVIPEDDSTTGRPIVGVIQLALGVLLLLLATKNWRSRPAPGEEAALPAWMNAIDSFTFGKALGLGFLLSGVNPKNLLLAAAAGVVIGDAALPAGEAALAIAVFTVVAASTVLIPVVAYLLASRALKGPLEATRVWLQHENAVIMSVLLLVLGVVLIGKGIGSF